MNRMGRKSTARKLLEGLPSHDSHDRTLLVLYDFHGGPPNPRFYASLHRITELTSDGSTLVQYSAYKTTSHKAALAAHTLASQMGAETVIFEAAERSPDDLRRHLKEVQEEPEEEKNVPKETLAEANQTAWSPALYPRLTSLKYPSARLSRS